MIDTTQNYCISYRHDILILAIKPLDYLLLDFSNISYRSSSAPSPIPASSLALNMLLLDELSMAGQHKDVKKPDRRLLKLPQPYGRGIGQFTSSELKSAEAENRSASPGLTPGEFREGGLNL